MNARRAVAMERERRSELAGAVAELVFEDPGAGFPLGDLRRQLRLYYGAAMADGATIADLHGLVAIAGGYPSGGWVFDASLRRPSREALRKVRDKWNKGLPPAELPMIRQHHTLRPDSPDFPDAPADHPVKVEGRWYQTQDPATRGVIAGGGTNSRRIGTRYGAKRRFPSYVAALRGCLDKVSTVSAVDRQIVEFIIEGRTIRWIADELGMKAPTVQKRVRQFRVAAGISGPGSGR